MWVRFDGLLKKTGAKRLWLCIIVFAAGTALMLLGGYADSSVENSGAQGAFQPTETGLTKLLPTEAASAVGEATEAAVALSGYEEALENKLSNKLSKVHGAGRVQVALTLSEADGVELARDVTYELSEGNAEKSETKHVLITEKDGRSEPIVIKRAAPKAEGVVIIAEGAGDAEIKSALARAAGALLNLPAHKIEVLKMGKQ